MTVRDLADEVSRDTPAPGGGSIAALAGALGAGLAAMVANLTHGKAAGPGVTPADAETRDARLSDLAERAQEQKEPAADGRRRRHRCVSTTSSRPDACPPARPTRRPRGKRPCRPV
jgi:glutamate formiminotransferase/formiminotetrahydrofolate cyclodeaminase